MKKIIKLLSHLPYKFFTAYYRNHLAFDLQVRLRQRALDASCAYIEKHMVDVPLFKEKQQALDYALKEVKIQGAYCEFGVYKGKSVNYIASTVDQEVHAFDSFEGLPEDWSATHKKGAFALDGMPDFAKNVVVHKGWFDDTLPIFMKDLTDNIAFLHVDCDLYSSTKAILGCLNQNIVKGTIILFDEYFNYPFWEHHEYKAFQEFVQENEVGYEYLCFSSGTYGSKVAVRILNRN